MAYKYGYCDGFTDDLCGAEEPSNNVVTGKLGCSQHVAYIQGKCNGARLCELLDVTSLGYDRRLDDISEAFVEVAIGGDVDNPCCACVGDVEPWCHVLTIVREGDGVVWTGPVTKVIYGFNSVRIEAKDKLAWLQVRANGETLTGFNPNPGIQLTTIALDIVTLAMASDGDSPCFLDCVLDLGDGLPPGTNRDHEDFIGFGGPTAWDDLVTMGNTGVDFTVVNQCLILTGEQLPPVAIGTLLDEHILGDVSIIKDGFKQANTVYVRYTGDDDCTGTCTPQGTGCPNPDTCPCPCPALAQGAFECYGEIDKVITGLDLPNVLSASVVAQIYLNQIRLTPRLVEFPSGTRLSPDTPWTLSDMIPGQRIDVSLTKLCLPLFQSFKLQQVTVQDSGTGEEISIDLKALNSLPS